MSVPGAMDRREFAAALAAFALLAGRGEGQAQDGAEFAHAQVYRFSELTAVPQANGGWARQVLEGTLPTGEFVEVHETMVPAGKMPHAPHRHTNSEFLLIREGSLEVLDERGAAQPCGPGDVVYTASGRLHGMRNVGTAPALYFVVSVGVKRALPG